MIFKITHFAFKFSSFAFLTNVISKEKFNAGIVFKIIVSVKRIP